jgi:hypothetical protein
MRFRRAGLRHRVRQFAASAALSPAGLICGGAFGWLRRAVLVIVNFSYRGDGELDRADLARLGGTAGFRVLRNGSRAFALWNGLAFHLVRAR